MTISNNLGCTVDLADSLLIDKEAEWVVFLGDLINSEVIVGLSIEQVQNSPVFNPNEPLTDGQSDALIAHYNRVF